MLEQEPLLGLVVLVVELEDLAPQLVSGLPMASPEDHSALSVLNSSCPFISSKIASRVSNCPCTI